MATKTAFRISITPSKLTGTGQKKYKEDHLNEILSTICALLNSAGGEVVLHLNSASKQVVHDILKMIEQKISEMIGVSRLAMNITSEALAQQILFTVKQSKDLVTVRYNFCLPSQTQVIVVPSNEAIQHVRTVLLRGCNVNGSRGMRSRQTFTKGKNLGSLESTDIQYKNLKASASKCVRLADRITSKSNKLPNYVSAFANYGGGHILYGVTDDGVVEGEEVSEKERKRVNNKVEKMIKNMIWPEKRNEVKKGIHWNIFFEPVKDEHGGTIPSCFVVVIYIAPCQGGVFLEKPESYHIVQGKVEKMSLSVWLGKLKETPIPAHIPQDANRKIHTI